MQPKPTESFLKSNINENNKYINKRSNNRKLLKNILVDKKLYLKYIK